MAVFSIKNLYTKSKIPAVFLNSFLVSENKSSETETGILVSENKFAASENKSVSSSGGANNSLKIPAVVACDGKKSFAVYNSSGEKEFSVSTENEIRMIKPLNSCAGFSGDFRRNSGQSSVRDSGNNSGNDLGKIAVLDGIGRLLIYDLNTKSLVGYIPVGTSLTDFEFNNDDSHILLGYENGSVYNISFKDGLLKPGEEPENIGDGSGFYGGSLGGSGTSSFGGGFSGFGGVGKTQDFDSLVINAGGNYFISPYNGFGVGLGINYQVASLFSFPILFGLNTDFTFSFTGKDFPMKYKAFDGSEINPPSLFCASINLPFGIYQYHEDKKITFGANIFCGGKIFRLLSFYDYSAIYSKIYAAPLVGVEIFVCFHNFSGIAKLVWDSTFGFVPSVNFGYRIKMPALGKK